MRVLAGMNQNSTLIAASNSMSVAQDFDHLQMNDRGNRMQIRFECVNPGTDWGVAGYCLEVTRLRHKR